MQQAFAHCEALVRAADRDRFLAALFAPRERRGALFALYAFNVEIARVREVVYGTAEPKTGALASTLKALESPGLNHRFLVTSGVLADECRSIIQEFFRERRRPGVEGTRQV